MNTRHIHNHPNIQYHSSLYYKRILLYHPIKHRYHFPKYMEYKFPDKIYHINQKVHILPQLNFYKFLPVTSMVVLSQIDKFNFLKVIGSKTSTSSFLFFISLFPSSSVFSIFIIIKD